MCVIKPYVRRQLFVALCVYLGQMVLCFCRVWPNSGLFLDPEKTPLPHVITHTQEKVIEAVFHVGIILGTFIVGFISNTAGRKPCFFIAAFLCLCAYILLATVRTLVTLFISKFLIGLGTGISYVAILVYLGEAASTNIRGLILTSTNMFVFVQSWLDIVINYVSMPYFVWAYIGAAVSGFFLLAVFYVPESPVFLTMKGTNENLERSLLALGREDELPTMLSKKIEQQALKKTHADNWLEIFKVKSNRKAIFITLTLNVLQTVSGFMGIVYFMSKFLFPIELFSFKVLTIIFNACSSAGAFSSLFLVEKVGRKTLLMISTGSCGISLGILSTYFILDMWLTEHEGYLWIYFIIWINYFFSYCLGFRIVPETLIGEFFTTNVRSTGAAFVISMSFVANYLYFIIMDLLVQNIGFNFGVLFIVFCFTSILAFIFTLFLVPETKGLTFNEINEMLSKKKLINLN